MAEVAQILLPGGRYYLHEFNVEFPLPNMPRKVDAQELQARFTADQGWQIREIQPVEFLSRVAPPVPAISRVYGTAACLNRSATQNGRSLEYPVTVHFIQSADCTSTVLFKSSACRRLARLINGIAGRSSRLAMLIAARTDARLITAAIGPLRIWPMASTWLDMESTVARVTPDPGAG